MDYEKIAAAANKIDKVIRENQALKSLIVETSSLVTGDQSQETRQSIQEFLDSPLGDKKEIAMEKAYAAAMVLAKERGLLPNLPESSHAIASIVDEGLTRVKANYQVGVGILDPEKAIDHIVDHAESRAIAYVDAVFEPGVISEVVTEGVVKLAYAIPEIGPIIGPIAENYRPIIKSVIASVEQPVREAIKIGIHAVATTAKTIARKAIEVVKNVAKNIVSLLS
jgi:hypothetical protein